MAFDLTPNVYVERDAKDNVVHLRHIVEPYRTAAEDATALAVAYLRDAAHVYGFGESLLQRAGEPIPGAFDAAQSGAELRFASTGEFEGTTVVSFAQVVYGLPVWEAGFAVTIQEPDAGVVSSRTTVERRMKVRVPDSAPRDALRAMTAKRLAAALGLEKPRLKISGTSLRVYRYERRLRTDLSLAKPREKGAHPLAMPLPAVPKAVTSGRHYVVVEALFSYAPPGGTRINWRAFVEVDTGAVLYLRPLVASCNGYVYLRDPRTRGSSVLPGSPLADLNALRDDVPLPGLTASDPQALVGEFVRVEHAGSPAPPTVPAAACNFYYDVPSDDFAAVSAYFTTDRIYRLMQDVGVDIPTYFGAGTTFPIAADHRGLGNWVNTQTVSNSAGDGITGYSFGLVSYDSTIGSAINYRTMLHELSHHLLHARVHSGFFGFAHSCGDSLNAVVEDPGNLSSDRGLTHQWVFPGASYLRRHDRTVAADWGWDGPNDTGALEYKTEQILSSTLFRLYRMSGGDAQSSNAAAQLAARRFASRLVTRLIIRALAGLGPSPITATPTVRPFVTALMQADSGTTTAFEGLLGGLFQKIIPWSFEKQGLDRAPGAPTTAEGAPPLVDVYIDDGRSGQYAPYLDVFWETTDIWNQRTAGSPYVHEEPLLGVTNYAYVRIRNRGSQTANGVVVRGYHCRPGTGMAWPADFQPMTTAQLSPPGGTLAPGANVRIGPFHWTPNAANHECLLMTVSADGDPANTEAPLPCAAGPTPDAWLVRLDNNIAQRNVFPQGSGEFPMSMEGEHFWVGNPFPRRVRVRIETHLPPLLEKKGWRVQLGDGKDVKFALPARKSRRVDVSVIAGEPISSDEWKRLTRHPLRILVFLDDQLSGGMTYPFAAPRTSRKS